MATNITKIDGVITDEDRDSLHILPLAMVELQTSSIRNTRLIKNAQLDTVIEMFEGRHTGSGQLDLNGLRREMNWNNPTHPDVMLLHKLFQLPSFDVYSLRILFRANNIPIRSQSALTLSDAKKKELSSYMTKFTRPLIREIYQTEDVKLDTFDDILGVFRNPDIKKVQERLRIMSESLGIEISEIPNFLEDYGDTFLSLSYYRRCLDQIVPTMDSFLESLRQFKTNYQLANDQRLLQTCEYMETTINALLTTTTGRLENFEQSTSKLMSNVSAEGFRRIESLIKQYQVGIGAILCGLSVKMDAWARQFPNAQAGGLLRRAEFVMSSMRPGLNHIKQLEDSNPMLAGLGRGAPAAPVATAA
jgi:hypothetical protein